MDDHVLSDRQVLLAIVVLAAVFVAAKPLAMRSLRRTVERGDLNAQPLHDVGHALLPDLSRAHRVGDAMSLALAVGGGAYLLATGRRDLLARITFVFLLVSVLKLVVANLTVLPDPSGTCREKERGVPLQMLGACNDLFPSGHMAVPFAALAVCHGRVPSGVWNAAAAYTAVQAFVTVATRNHYTIDVLGSLVFVLALAPLAR